MARNVNLLHSPPAFDARSFGEIQREVQLVLPISFLTELELFKTHNSLATTYSLNGHQKIHCCKQCLKAHALKVASEQELGEAIIRYLEMVFSCETGHNGYYLNQEYLIKI